MMKNTTIGCVLGWEQYDNDVDTIYRYHLYLLNKDAVKRIYDFYMDIIVTISLI